VAEPFSGVVLTGGRSERMGRDKALLELDGESMATRATRAVRDAGAVGVVCVGGDAPALRALGLVVIDDEHPDAGPLGGLLTGLAQADGPITLIAPCDLVAPSAPPLRALVDALATSDVLAAVPIVDGHWRPLPAAVRTSAHAPLAAAFAAGERAIRRAMEQLSIVALDVGPLADADSPEDLPGHR
jgi:molybdopterin-guanine dinucleotide biosynthesis protein A